MASKIDAVHALVGCDAGEAKVLSTAAMWRLSFIRQLGTSFLVLLGASHFRLEHVVGVMHLAGRIFDVITNPANLTETARQLLMREDLEYWRRVLRLAALLHDIGHLAFSHAAERELLPVGWDHERLTDLLICSAEMKPLWRELGVEADHVAKLALGPSKFGPDSHRRVDFTPWERVLAEVVVADAFGADRMDYLLRDAHHTGCEVRISREGILNSLRILSDVENGEPRLGIVEEGLGAVEGLMMGRHLMYKDVYFHPQRKAYDFHLQSFLKAWLPQGRFHITAEEHLKLTDNEVLTALAAAARDEKLPGHDHARRFWTREPFQLVYKRNPDDFKANSRSGKLVAKALSGQFGTHAAH